MADDSSTMVTGVVTPAPADGRHVIDERRITLTLCTPDGTVVGDLEPFTIPSPQLQEMEMVVREAETLLSRRVTVLRLLDASPDVDSRRMHARYLAQVETAPAGLRPSSVIVAEHPRRMPWARAGGPDAYLAWAREALADQGIVISDRPRQIRSWNLSSIWRIRTADGTVWLKTVPPFFAHEPDVVEAVGDLHAPRVIATRAGATLYRDVPGDDAYGAPVAARVEMLRRLTEIHLRFTESAVRERGWDLPDWRSEELGAAARDLLVLAGDALQSEDRRILDSHLDRWDQTSAALEACGVPFTLIHGDFHPGNVKVTATGMTILDWADSGIGHPGFDVETCAHGLSEEDRDHLRGTWHTMWTSQRPGADTSRALQLLPPMAALRRAVLYQRFLDGIEPSEHVYHAGDPARWLAAAARAVSRRPE